MSDMSHIVELHLHLDGSLRPETVWELAKEQGVELPAKSAEEVKYMMEVPEDCKTLEEYLERFDLPLLVLQKADAIERVTLNWWRILRRRAWSMRSFDLRRSFPSKTD